MKITRKSIKHAVSLSVALSAGAFATSALAYPFTAEQIAEQEAALLESVNLGYNLWHGSSPDTTTVGLACGNCHPGCGRLQSADLPEVLSHVR